MRNYLRLLAISASLPLLAANWTTFSGDPQRTGLVSGNSRLNKTAISALKLSWKAHLDNQTKQLTSLLTPLVTKELVIVAGSSDKIFALNRKTGTVQWTRHFDVTAQPKSPADWLCPNAQTATPAINSERALVYSLASDGRLFTLRLQDGQDAQSPRQMTPPFAKTWSLNLVNGVIYVPTSQACNTVRSAVYAISEEGGTAREFLAMRIYGAGIWGRAGVAVDAKQTVFAETGDGVYAPAKEQWPDSVLAIDGRTLELKDYFTPPNYSYVTAKDLDMGNITPAVFPYQGKQLIAASGKEGVIYLLDSQNLGGKDHMHPLWKSELFTNREGRFWGRGFWGGFSTWQDNEGARWLYAPAWGPATPATNFDYHYGDAPSGSIMAFEVTGSASAPSLKPVWRSTDMAVPEPAVIVNGMVLALSNGENITQTDEHGGLLKSEFRSGHPNGHAVLYAFDAQTGKTLFSSGNTISSFTHFGGLAVADNQLFLTTWDNTVYAFSID